MSDEQIICVKCGRPFTWSYGEQRFYAEHELHPPKRCPTCRPVRRVESKEMPRSSRQSRSVPPQARQSSFHVAGVQAVMVALAVVVAMVLLWWLLF